MAPRVHAGPRFMTEWDQLAPLPAQPASHHPAPQHQGQEPVCLRLPLQATNNQHCSAEAGDTSPASAHSSGFLAPLFPRPQDENSAKPAIMTLLHQNQP